MSTSPASKAMIPPRAVVDPRDEPRAGPGSEAAPGGGVPGPTVSELEVDEGICLIGSKKR
jgi:hypothetical protein